MRSHLLAKVATDDERNASGRAPDIFVFWFGEAWAGAAYEAVSQRPRSGSRVLLAGGDLAAEAQKIPYGMVPYARPVFKNGKRILWHGAWRGSALSRYARQSVAPAAAKPILALAPEPANRWLQRSSRSLRTPATSRASRMAKDFATVMSASGAPGRAIVGSTSPNGLGKVLKTDMADFAIVSLDSLLSSAKGDA